MRKGLRNRLKGTALALFLIGIAVSLRPRWVVPAPHVNMAPQGHPVAIAAMPPDSANGMLRQAFDLAAEIPAETLAAMILATSKLRDMPWTELPEPDPPGYGKEASTLETHTGNNPGSMATKGGHPEATAAEPVYRPFDNTHPWTVSEVHDLSDLLDLSRPVVDRARLAVWVATREDMSFDYPDEGDEEARRGHALCLAWQNSGFLASLRLTTTHARAQRDTTAAVGGLVTQLGVATLCQRSRGLRGWQNAVGLAEMTCITLHALAPTCPDAALEHMIAALMTLERRWVPAAEILRIQALWTDEASARSLRSVWQRYCPGEPYPAGIQAQARWGWLVGSSTRSVRRDLHRFHTRIVALAEEPYDAAAQRRVFNRLRPRLALLLHRDPIGWLLVAMLYRANWHPARAPYPGYEYTAWIPARSMLMDAGAMALVRTLRTSLAVRRFILGYGRPPVGLPELVPDYLPEVPLDPFTLEPLHYSQDNTAGNWRVFSLGQDRSPGGEDDVGWGSDWSAVRYLPPDCGPDL